MIAKGENHLRHTKFMRFAATSRRELFVERRFRDESAGETRQSRLQSRFQRPVRGRVTTVGAIVVRAQKTKIDQRLKHRSTRHGVHPAEALGLTLRQSQSGHLEVFSTNTFEQLLRSILNHSFSWN